jgi:hypothetical protein
LEFEFSVLMSAEKPSCVQRNGFRFGRQSRGSLAVVSQFGRSPGVVASWGTFGLFFYEYTKVNLKVGPFSEIPFGEKAMGLLQPPSWGHFT